MAFTNETLLPSTTFGVPSGNYNGSNSAFIGNAVPAANFYAGQGITQTAFIQVTNFAGVITLQATLGDIPEQAAWFDLESYGTANAATTGTVALTEIGNFVFIRAAVTDFTAGTVNTVTAAY